MNNIKTIIFDLSEVIISGYYGIEKIIERKTGILPQEFLKRKSETIELFFDLMRGKLTEDEYFNELLTGTNWKISVDDIKEMARENLRIPVKGTLEIIKKLKDKYKLVLLSDYTKEWKDYIIYNNKDLNIFDKKYFSCDLGKLKTDEGTFNIVLKDLGVNPNEVIFIDDSKENIEIAKTSGLNVILFKDAKDLEANLKKLNILD